MKNDRKFFKCNICGNMIEKIEDAGPDIVCCGQEMTLLVPNTTDAAQEKHVPVATRNGNVIDVQVGSVLHPMMAEHHIVWIVLAGSGWSQKVELTPACEPKASFCVIGDAPVTVYEYCNLHGLWASEL